MGRPKHFPWTTGWQPNYQSEGRVYAAYILEHKPDGKIGLLYQNDDFGKDYVKGSQRWPWRRGPIDDRRRRSLRDDGPHGRFAGDRHEGRRRRCLGQYRHPEIRRSGDPQGGYAPSVPQTLVQVLKQCDDNPTRENIMKKEEGGKLAQFLRADAVARKHDQYEPHGLCPDQANSDGSFDGEQWRLFGQLTTGKVVG